MQGCGPAPAMGAREVGGSSTRRRFNLQACFQSSIAARSTWPRWLPLPAAQSAVGACTSCHWRKRTPSVPWPPPSLLPDRLQGVLALNVPVPGLRRYFLLTKTLEWNLYWWVYLFRGCRASAAVDEPLLRCGSGGTNRKAPLAFSPACSLSTLLCMLQVPA